MDAYTVAAYGRVDVGRRDPRGGVSITADGSQLWAWAHRQGAMWPCSTLAGLDGIVVDFAPDGDLIDIAGPITRDELESIAGDELTAWSDDVLWERADELSLAIRETVRGRRERAGIVDGMPANYRERPMFGGAA
jgi:hypothetical protein